MNIQIAFSCYYFSSFFFILLPVFEILPTLRWATTMLECVASLAISSPVIDTFLLSSALMSAKLIIKKNYCTIFGIHLFLKDDYRNIQIKYAYEKKRD